MLQNCDHNKHLLTKNDAARKNDPCGDWNYNLTASVNLLQHKSLLLFLGKKVIVGKVKLCSRVEVDHDKRPPDTLAVDIIPPVVE